MYGSKVIYAGRGLWLIMGTILLNRKPNVSELTVYVDEDVDVMQITAGKFLSSFAI